MKNVINFIVCIFCFFFFSCKKEMQNEQSLEKELNKSSKSAKRENDSENIKTFKQVFFSDSVDLEHSITQTSDSISRMLVPYIPKYGAIQNSLFKYMLFEYSNNDIKNWEFIVSKNPISEMDLFNQEIYEDSIVFINTVGEVEDANISAHLGDGSIKELHDLYSPVAENSTFCLGGFVCIEWYLVVRDKVTHFVVYEEYVGETCIPCDNGDTGVGGGGGHSNDENERNELHTDVWTVAVQKATPRWTLTSSDELRGVSYPNSNPTKPSTFTTCVHNGEFFNSTTDKLTWVKYSAAMNVNNYDCYVVIDGKVQSNFPLYASSFVHKTKQWISFNLWP